MQPVLAISLSLLVIEPAGGARVVLIPVCFAVESCLSPMAAFWKPNSKVLPTRQRSFITVNIVLTAEVEMMELAAT